MGRPIATVTAAGVQEAPYTARFLHGGFVGRYPAAGAAQRAVDRSFGAGHLNWVREDLPGSIEHYVGYERAFWPIDLGTDLSLWLDSNQGIEPTELSGESRVTTWHSWDRQHDQTASQSTAASAPVQLAGAGPAELDLVSFGVANAEYLAVDLNVTPPYTLSAVASHVGTMHSGPDTLCSIGTERLQVSNGIWVWNTASGNISGPAAVDAVLTIVTLVHNGLAGELFINNVSAGTQADSIAASAVSISDATAYWAGVLASLVIANRAFGAHGRSTLVEYQAKRYGLTL